MKLKLTRSERWNAVVTVEMDGWAIYYGDSIFHWLFSNIELQKNYSDEFFYARLLNYMVREAFENKYSDEKIRDLYKLIMAEKPVIFKNWKGKIKKIYNKILNNMK